MSMKQTMKKISSLITIGVFGIIGAVPAVGIAPQIADAQMCNPGDTTGNLSGYAMTETIGAIYMSTESWNADPLGIGHAQTSVNFSVSFDRQINRWNGRGWNPHVGWVDFGQTNPNLIVPQNAQMESVAANPSDWGEWNSFINLSGVNYVTDPGIFVGYGTNGDYTILGGTGTIDDVVGTGYIDFSNVSLLLNSNCNESVDVLLNGVNVLYRPQCPITAPVIQWTSNDVTNCVATQGLWSGTKSTAGSEGASGPITESNTPVVFRLSCTGIGSGAVVYGDAYASCGDIGDPGGGGGPGGIDPTTGVVIPDFREV